MSALVGDGMAEVAVDLGVGRQADRGVWDLSTWDNAVWGAADTALGDWVDVTCDVVDKSLILAAGTDQADGVVTRWEAATVAFTLVGTRWSPWEGPYAGILGPSTQVRVRWRPVMTLRSELAESFVADPSGWYVAFNGLVDVDGYTWKPAHERHPERSLAEVAATDATVLLAGFDGIEQNAVGQGETAIARVNRILDMALWDTSLRDITGIDPEVVKETTLAEPAWTMLLAIADTDLALMWVRRDGRLTYRSKGRIDPPREVSATLVVCQEDDPTAVQVVDVTGGQPRVVRNIVSISRQARDGVDVAQTVTRRDDGSIARYRQFSYSRTDLQHTRDSWSGSVADAVLQSSAWPSNAPAATRLSSRLGDPASVALLMTIEPDMAMRVAHAGKAWLCSPSGWRVSVTRREISGSISLLDMGAWVAARWDSGLWDTDSWGF